MWKFDKNRRKSLVTGAQGLGIFAFGGLLWGAYVNKAKSNSLVLRPPGALEESDFLKKCTRCGLCVEVCPFDTLRLAKPEENVVVGTPYFVAREIPCHMCDDIPCVRDCPSGALEPKLVSSMDEEGNNRLDIEKAKMGIALIDTENCMLSCVQSNTI